MWENGKKAIKDHGDSRYYPALTPEGNVPVEVLPPLDFFFGQEHPSPLNIISNVHAIPHGRTVMQDDSFVLNFAEGTVAGVFDGHGTELSVPNHLATYVKTFVQDHFPDYLSAIP